ncbi:MAG: response regulator transcription factor [Actinobacteria bacterium]|nr:MAG: response regulator transcription factor [Actinomycetota bacterium]
MTRVLVVDDENDIRGLVRELLERAGHDVVEAPDGNEGLRLFYAEHPDVVILDVSMPGLTGWEVLERIRELGETPVIMLTANADELDKVRGLRAGADDYITKPFGRQELLARVGAQLRRRPAGAQEPATYADGFVTIDFTQRSVRAGDAQVALTPLEFRLLAAFVRHPNQVLSQDQLIELAWGNAGAAERDQVKLYVGYLRRKLGTPPGAESPIETMRGFGYRYRPPAAR